MLSKRNKKEFMRKVTDQRQRFSIRKYTIGAASVLIGLTFLGGYTTTVHAADTTPAVAQNANNTKASGENGGVAKPTDSQNTDTKVSSNGSSEVTANAKGTDQVNNDNKQGVADSTKQESTVKSTTPVSDSQKSEASKEKAETTTVKTGDLSNASTGAAGLGDSKITAAKDKSAAQNAMNDSAAAGTPEALDDSISVNDGNSNQDDSNFNVNDWNTTDYTGTIDGQSVSGISISYKNDPTNADVYVPNTDDFIKAGTITPGQKAYITDGNLKAIGSKAKTITIHKVENDSTATTSTNNNTSGGLVAVGFDYHATNPGRIDAGETNALNGVFSGNSNLTSIDASGLDVSQINDLQNLFADNPNLTTVTGLDKWDTSKNLNIGHMFANDPKLVYVEGLDKWGANGTQSLKYIDNLFIGDTSYTNNGNTLDLSNWNTDNVVLASDMFNGASSLTGVNLTGWTLKNVQTTSQMFRGTTNLTSIGDNFSVQSNNWTDAGNMFNGSGITKLDMSNSKLTNNVTTTDMFANLVNPAVITMNNVGSENKLAASDFAGDQPLVVISNTLNADTLNQGTVTNGTGHPANKITINYTNGDTPTNTTTTKVRGVQSNFVYSSADDLNSIQKLVAGSTGNTDLDKVIANGATATLTAGYNGANVNSTSASDIDKVMGTYAISQYQDVTQSEIDDGSYPTEDEKTATYNVVERFPDTYTGEGTMSAADYAAAIGDTDVSKYAGYVYKILANQTVTAYETATKNFVNNEVTYSTPYNSKYLDYKTTTPNVWDHKYSDQDKTYIGSSPVDTPEGYTISANPQSYTTSLKDNRNPGIEMLQISYNPTAHTFHYDFMNSTSDANARDNITFNRLPDSYNFYIDYTKDPSVTFQYVDTQEDNKVVGSQAFTKPSDSETVDFTSNQFNIPANYELADGQTLPDSYTFPSDSNQTVQIKLKHKTQDTQVTEKARYLVVEQLPTAYTGTDAISAAKMNSDIAQYNANLSANFKLPQIADGYLYKVLVDQSVNATRTDVKDLVTGDVTPGKYIWSNTNITNATGIPGQATDNPNDPNDKSEVVVPTSDVDEIPGYTRTEPIGEYGGTTSNSNPLIKIYNYPSKGFIFDFSYGSSPADMTYTTLPASQIYYVTYAIQNHTSNVNFVYKNADGTATTIDSVAVTGDTGTTKPVTATVPAGWKLAAGQSVPTEIAFTYTGDTANFEPDYDVYIEHNTITVTPDQPHDQGTDLVLPDGDTVSDQYKTTNDGEKYPAGVSENDLNKTVTRIIEVKKPGATDYTPIETQNTKFTRTATIDLVTGEVTYENEDVNNGWQQSGDNGWTAFSNIPSVVGYTPSQTSVEAGSPTYNVESPQYVKIDYIADNHSVKITFKDESGNTVGNPITVSGDTGDTGVKTNASVPAGWTLANDDETVPTTVDFTYNGDKPNFGDKTIIIEHNTITLTPDQVKDGNLPDGTVTSDTYPTPGKVPAAATDVTKTVTRTINVTKPGETQPTSTKQEANFTRNVTIDLVDGSAKYGDWTGNDKWNAFTPESIPGYTTVIDPADSNLGEVTPKADDSDVTINVTYKANPQTGKISYTYTDKDGKTTEVGNTSLNGVTDSDVAINPVAPDGWKIVEGQDIPESEKATANGIPTVTVKVEHNLIPVTPEDSGQPLPDGTKTSDEYKDDNGDNYPSGVTQHDVEQDITRTITVVNPDGTSQKPVVQTAEFTRPMYVDLVTGSTVPGDWTLDDSNNGWDAYPVTDIPGYTTHISKNVQGETTALTSIEADKPANVDSPDQAITVTYTANDQTGNIIYKDSAGNTIGTSPLTGKTGETVPISPVAPDGYEIVPDQGTPTTEKATADGIPDVTVKVVPATIQVTPDKPVNPGTDLPDGTKTSDKYPTPGKYPAGVSENDLNKTVTRKINVTDPTTGKTTTTTQEVKFTRTATVNLVDGSVSYTDWAVDGTDTLPAYTAPEIPGYTADKTASEIDNVPEDGSYADVNIGYTANPETGKISYVDGDGNEVGTSPLNGKTDETVPVDPNTGVPAGWKIVPNQKIPKSEKATATGIPTVTVKVEHATTTVQPTDPKTPTDTLPDNPGKTYPAGVSESDLNKTVVRTINVTKPDGSVTTTTQTTKLSRIATVDEVTGDVTYGDWSISQDNSNENKTGWPAFSGEANIPTIAGYTPSQTSVDPVTDVNTLLEGNKTVNITYSPNAGGQTITYVDKNGNSVGGTTIPGKTGDTEKVDNPNIPAGWVIVDKPGNKVPEEVTIKPKNDPIKVEVQHGTVTVTPDEKTPEGKLPDNPTMNYPELEDLSKTVTRTITVTKPDGTKTTTKQVTKLTRTATVDEVTGAVTYTPWGISGDNGWTEFNDVPEVKGYTPSQKSVDPVTDINTLLKGDSPVNISYIPEKNSVGINYVDEQGNVVHTQEVDGVTDQTVTGIKSEVPAGWELVPGQKVPTEVKIPADSSTFIPVKIQHKSTVVTYEDPKTPSDSLPDNPDKNYPEGVTKDDLYREVTRTINVTNPDGSVTRTKQKVELTRTATVDEVNGNVTYGSWNIEDGSWPEFTTPDKAGYTPSQVGVSPVTDPTILADNGDQTVDITYTANPQSIKIVYQTPDGQVISTTPVTGVTDQTVDLSIEAPDGYSVSGTVPTSYTFKADNNGNIIVTVVADTPEPSTPVDNSATVIVKYRDPDGKIVDTKVIPGTVGETVDTTQDVPEGYKVVAGQDTTYTINSTGDHEVVINVEPVSTDETTTPVKPNEDNHKADTAKTEKGEETVAPTKSTKGESSKAEVGNAKADSQVVTKKTIENNVAPKANAKSEKTEAEAKSGETADKKTLPQTGEEDTRAAGLLGAILASVGLAGLGIGKKKRKRD